MAQLVLRVCETVYHSIIRHVKRLVGTSGCTKARLETVVCEPSVREPCASGAPISHTISTSEALLRVDACTSIDSCLLLVGAAGWYNISTGGTLVLVLLGAPVWHTISTSGPCCERMPRPASAHALCHEPTLYRAMTG